MRHKRAGSKLGRVTAHREALFRSLLAALFRHERITTTTAKAKALRPLADHVVTLSKRDGLIPDTTVVRRLFDTVAARYAERRGGYTRIVPVRTRRGDGAPVAILELVDRPEVPKEKTGKGKKPKEPKGKEAKKARRAAETAAAHG
jgi:large subunit ribosomal protein L17